jgi:hypothetical protein
MEKRDPRTVVAIILGGGAGTRLFPLTKRRAKPAVSLILLHIFHVHQGLNILKLQYKCLTLAYDLGVMTIMSSVTSVLGLVFHCTTRLLDTSQTCVYRLMTSLVEGILVSHFV